MLIDSDLCMGCWECLDYCPVSAIGVNENVAVIDLDSCVECGTCLRSAPCPSGAFNRPELEWPRSLRQWFSDPTSTIPRIRSLGAGRGVDEVKNNDRTGYYHDNHVGFIVEMGRPGVSASFRDIEKLLTALAEADFHLVDRSPMIPFLASRQVGRLMEEILWERVLSCSLEFKMPMDRIPRFIEILRQVENELSTVFTVGLLSIIHADLSIPTFPLLANLGVSVRPNAKINVGLGRPLAAKLTTEDRSEAS